jgi:hypothetical protein
MQIELLRLSRQFNKTGAVRHRTISTRRRPLGDRCVVFSAAPRHDHARDRVAAAARPRPAAAAHDPRYMKTTAGLWDLITPNLTAAAS